MPAGRTKAAAPAVQDRHEALDQLLESHRQALGEDFTAYRNHTYRVLNFAGRLIPPLPGGLDRVAIAAAFHDLGIWTARTFDYLAPSRNLADAFLRHTGKTAWIPEITAMIEQHHKITRYRGRYAGLVEGFRQADWVDVTLGWMRFGLPRPFLREVFDRFPDAGFHRRLVQLFWGRLRSHPLSPLPMYRL